MNKDEIIHPPQDIGTYYESYDPAIPLGLLQTFTPNPYCTCAREEQGCLIT